MAEDGDKDGGFGPLERLMALTGGASPEQLQQLHVIVQSWLAAQATPPVPDKPDADATPPAGEPMASDALATEVLDVTKPAEGAAEPTKEEALKARKALEAFYDPLWTRTLAEELAGACPACAALPLRPLTLGIVECQESFHERVAKALNGEATDDLVKFQYKTVVHDADALAKKKAYDTGAKLQAALRREMLSGNAVVLCTRGNLPPAVTAMASWTVRLEDVNPRILAFARLMRAGGKPLDMADGTPFEDLWPAERCVPYERIGGVCGWLWDTVQGGGIVTDAAMSRLEDVVATEVADGPGIAPGGPQGFDEVPGLHPRTRSRLGVLLRRMQAAMDNPPGILLVGPPGTGKTMLAGLLAKGTGRAFVETSATEWVAAGHLGDTLAMMRGKFAEARSRAPSLIFIDELDTMGRRGGGDHNEQWTRMFINGLLECLQGLGGRGDVAVVAATNHAHSIDPAIVREGRIGEHVEVPLPNRTGRREVLDFYLPGPLRERVDTLALADRVGPCSPAKIRALAEETVLQGRGDPTPDHLEQAFQAMAGQLAKGHDPERLALSVCSGLAGEAVMTALAYGTAARIDGISSKPGLADLGRVSVTHATEAAPSATAGDLRRLLQVAVAPGVARRLVASRTAKGPAPMLALEFFSPVAEAEQHLAYARAEAFLRSGVVPSALGQPWQQDQAADAVVATARKQVRKALVPCLDALVVLTDMLVRDGEVGPGDFARIVGFEGDPSRRTVH